MDYYKHALQYMGLPSTRIPTHPCLERTFGNGMMVEGGTAHGAGPCLTLAGGVARPKVLPRTADMCQDYLTRPLPHIALSQHLSSPSSPRYQIFRSSLQNILLVSVYRMADSPASSNIGHIFEFNPIIESCHCHPLTQLQMRESFAIECQL